MFLEIPKLIKSIYFACLWDWGLHYFLLNLLSETDKNYAAIENDNLDSRVRRRARKGVTESDMDEIVPTKAHQRRRRQQDEALPVGNDDISQPMLDYIADNLDVRYNTVGNDGGRFHVDIILTNVGNRVIPACCWIIYLYHMKYDLNFALIIVNILFFVFQ